MLVIRDTVFRDTLPSMNGSTTIVEQLRGSVIFIVQERELRVEVGSRFSWQMADCPLNGQDVESPKQTSSSGGQFLTCGSDARPVLMRPCSLIALRAALYLPPFPSNTRCLGTFRTGGMSSVESSLRKPVGMLPVAEAIAAISWWIRPEPLFKSDSQQELREWVPAEMALSANISDSIACERTSFDQTTKPSCCPCGSSREGR